MARIVGAVLGLLLASFESLSAQPFPSRPITLIVPFAAGGPTDVLARIVADGMAPALSQTIVIENVTGAAGAIAGARLARAASDGYTIGIGNWSTHVLNGAIYPLSYDLVADFSPIALLADNPELIIASNKVPARDLRGLMSWAKQNQEKVTVGTGAAGSQIGGVNFQNLIDAKFQFVFYRGAAPVMQDLIAGRIDLFFDQASSSLPFVRNGQVKAYAVTAPKRLSVAPEIPTVDEAGLPGFHISLWHGLWAPKGTPPDIVAKLNQAVLVSLADAARRARLSELGQEVPAPERQTPDVLAAHQKDEIAKWWPITRAANIKPD